jgi:hypothetical protein
MPLSVEDLDQAVTILLRPENLEIVQRMQLILSTDPSYLNYHEASTAIQVRKILWSAESLYVRDDVDAILILREAVRRIPGTSAA